MPRPRQTEAQKDVMRQKIVEAALEILHEKGPDALSIRAITERVGVSHMVFYTYFENHDALVVALRERQRQHIMQKHAQMINEARTGDVKDVMRRSLGFFAQHALKNPRGYRIFLTTPGYDSLDERGLRLRELLKYLAELIELGIERGVFVRRKPHLAAATVFSMANGPLFIHYGGGFSDETLRDEMVKETLTAAMDYLVGQTSAPPEIPIESEQIHEETV